MAHAVGFHLTGGGQDSASPAILLPDTQYARGANVAIRGMFPSTRIRARVVPLSGPAADYFATENIQGGIHYNPAEGQGAVSFGKEDNMLLVGVGGRRLTIRLEGNGATVEDVSNGVEADPQLHLMFFDQWENYAVSGDGNGNTWIWDGNNPAFASPGYNPNDKPNSRVPNGGTVMVYAHGRGSIVVNSRAVLVGDIINAQHQDSAVDVTFFRDAVYWATMQFFAPPTKMGKINAGKVLPLRSSQHGHGPVVFHCDGGMFSVDWNVFPRDKWSETALVKTAFLGAGASGPYAVTVFEGDHLYRSKAGVQTLRSAEASSQMMGNPQKPISEPVDDFFATDPKQYLRFACVEGWESQRRAFITTAPIVQGRFRWHRAIASLNFRPMPTQDVPAVFEGVWTLPPQAAGIVQMISGDFDGDERYFALCRGQDGRNRLVEFREDLQDDVLEDGTRQRVRCALTTRRLNMNEPFTEKNVTTGTLFISELVGRVDWGVWYRRARRGPWVFWRSGFVDNAQLFPENDICNEPAPWEGSVPLGKPPAECGKVSSRAVQFLIRWAGVCSMESLRVAYNSDTAADDQFKEAGLEVKLGECSRVPADYSDFEYADVPEEDSWLKQPKP